MDEDPASDGSARYRAFISYSHGDARFARWLHRKLESWRLPDKSRVAPVFIDRAELSAGSDLSAQVRAALSESAALLVICSPSARASRWVGQEIALFRELHPDRPVLAALIEGEPDEAFPEPLTRDGERHLEPLAADFRKGHDGQRLGLLKLVAGLTGLPLDQVVQRDAQARQRRVMAVTAGALALVLILSAALVFALRARAEAERQRAEAEGLVEFMLTDLRDKLKGTGDPKIMASVNQRALDYYSHMDVTKLPDDSLDRRARVLHAMGEDNERLGNFPAAQRMYQEAWRITDEVLKRHPEDPDAIFTHAQSEFWVGKAAWQQQDLETTGRHWQGYLHQAEALEREEPGTVRALMEQGYANGNLCELTARRDRTPAKALVLCEKASSLMREALAKQPDNKEAAMALANRLGWQADQELLLGNLDESLTLRDEEAGLIDRLLAGNPGNFDLRVRRLWPEAGIGKVLAARGHLAEARGHWSRALGVYRQLARQRPQDKSLIEQQFRLVWLLTRHAANAAEERGWLLELRKLYAELKTISNASQLQRYTELLAQLEGGN